MSYVSIFASLSATGSYSARGHVVTSVGCVNSGYVSNHTHPYDPLSAEISALANRACSAIRRASRVDPYVAGLLETVDSPTFTMTGLRQSYPFTSAAYEIAALSHPNAKLVIGRRLRHAMLIISDHVDALVVTQLRAAKEEC